ncbi:Glyoxalase/Bleomycin resistance protein/Dihydroxybiphenyl dioxygenase [Aspergillus saccharolyticus JOP 1030-1]|uniref:4-hydroxyphenylpyruvate dioxygenase n=1 Tax=Aspergillus saccharolyticus JOP 1030-1 TaxID=1450539 RepID=A0A318ZCP5_9EURO|nr:Glyoxalase/Bleomycin resistance protein/Dihydroxybiphenyl dioxygenase [Aspergillus saccharolyticus JOP 1030-1]PYH45236.1 Glyoxalase/Bleomycin resistance protein/Dihydroxybiphenyl dioxygenase [Aspergillus saccharolyticus JOP 1030-1]
MDRVKNRFNRSSWYCPHYDYFSSVEKDISPSNLGPEYVGFDHMTGYVGNAKQAASYSITLLDFEHVAYRGPGTSSRTYARDEKPSLAEIQAHLAKHGDGVKDVAFRIEGDVESVWKRAVDNGATSIASPPTLVNEENGSLLMATANSINQLLPPIDFVEINHCVGCQPSNVVDSVCLDFHRYWTGGDSNMCGEYSAMRSIVVASPNEVIKMPMNEPASGEKRSQIEDSWNSAGVQHMAFQTHDIVTAVTGLKQRGMAFLRIAEEIDRLRELHILVDFDEKGYLLQFFTKHVLDRPTVFLEVIQRNNFDGHHFTPYSTR